jgi:hypothetical protein
MGNIFDGGGRNVLQDGDKPLSQRTLWEYACIHIKGGSGGFRTKVRSGGSRRLAALGCWLGRNAARR